MKNVEIAQWLKGLPLAPEFRPTDTEFSDPIAYISKIEREASAFGICKVIPPFPKPSKKYVLHNLNKSLSKCPELGSDVKASSSSKINGDCGESRALFTTRSQELGRSVKKKMKGMAESQPFGAQKQVWQSGEVYTLDQFEAKSKTFARNQLGTTKDVSPLTVEAMFWKAVSQEPIYVEYANDVPGSGFGEPEGVSNINRKKRRRRKRAVFDRNNDSKNEVDSVNSDNIDKDSCCASPNLCTESPSACSTPSQPSQVTSVPGPKGLSDGNDVEGTAGWKLSNSSWNLQVIARSPGSITRYMPDDIPGVTSPMVYIGMLFSWFAWHVEDHELHSLNFLHMGSPKTWYAVPGDYALKFEEVTRVHAYGDTTDRLAALTLLGEKTTLLPPEVIVSSGIPCCRLVQYPGEFVVTFPRAYHVGFSHGFNCGEAANFGTPQWLTVAKDAAVRRAAMNYLPMLSHQQLLYLLTMSFVSRVPKSLLPGVRSSRLRDRQKEGRETLVKKAFVEDVLKENELVTILLQKNSSYQAVVWDVNMLPSSSKEFEMQKCVGTDVKAIKGSEQTENYNSQDLLRQMNSYMESLSDSCVDDDDLSNDFHIDSGALPCIACGILGFPFMAVVQPSEEAAKNLFLEDCHTMQNIGDLKAVDSHSHKLQDGIVEGNVAVDRSMPQKRFLHSQEVSSCADSRQSSISHMEDQPPSDGHSISPRNVALEGKRDVYNKFLRPQIFCLEHAIQTEELLRSRGGAKVLIICHSDFQKIRGYAACIAEEMDPAFVYNEIPLDNASDEHLHFIDLAIEDGNSECVEDWTSKLCINLLHSVKLSRNCPAKKLQYALIVSRLFPDTALSTKCLSFKWESRKVRSKRKLNCQAESKPSVSLKIEEEKGLGAKLDIQTARERNIVIQYTRKRYKLRPCTSTDVSKAFVEINTLIPHEISNADEKARCESESALIRNGCAGDGSLDMGVCTVASKEKPELHLGCQTLTIEDQNETSHSKDSPVITSVLENHLAHPKDSESEKLGMDLPDPDIESNNMPVLHEMNDVESSVHIERVHFETSACSIVAAVCSTEVSESLKQPDCMEISTTDKAIDLPKMPGSEKGRDCNILTDGSVTGVSTPTNSSGSCSDGPSEQISDEEGQVGRGIEASDFTKLHKKTGDEIQSGKDLDDTNHLVVRSSSRTNVGGKRRRELDLLIGSGGCNDGIFVKSPCEGLRPRARKDDASGFTGESKKTVEEKPSARKLRNYSEKSSKKEQRKGSHRCDFDGCKMSFQTKTELSLHKRNRCHIDGCGKKFSSHKYTVLHQRVHEDDRPLKCTWKGCTMSFKWAWARTEHLRVHTGERPYKCKVEGCGLTFRFVSDFSRHRRKTGHHSR